jgi:hypothetical protein
MASLLEYKEMYQQARNSLKENRRAFDPKAQVPEDQSTLYVTKWAHTNGKLGDRKQADTYIVTCYGKQDNAKRRYIASKNPEKFQQQLAEKYGPGIGALSLKPCSKAYLTAKALINLSVPVQPCASQELPGFSCVLSTP